MNVINDRISTLKDTLITRNQFRHTWRKKFEHPIPPSNTPIQVTGGIGDLIVSLNACETLNAIVGDCVVYSKYPAIGALFSSLPQRPCFIDTEEGRAQNPNGLQWFIKISGLVEFQLSKQFTGFHNPKMNQVFYDYNRFLQSHPTWNLCVNHHPDLDGLLAETAVKLGYNRQTLSHAFLGLNYQKAKNIPKARYEFFKRPYITIHDGVDENHKNTKRANKTWDLIAWERFVFEFKKKHTNDIQIVQLGGINSRPVRGVHHQLIGKTTFLESMNILSNSFCHIDGDSGLVHVANRYGVRSVVLFGPTNTKYFAYKENINLESHFCGNCFWLTPDWIFNCPAGYGTPKCMDSISPEEVILSVNEVLFGK